MHTKEIKGVIINEQAQTRAMILELVQQKGVSQATSASYVQSLGAQEPAMTGIDEKENGVRKWILDSLGFAAMQNRQEEVAEAYHTTFEWMFEEPEKETKPLPWTNFVEWLRHGNGIYWVNGKAGSGKSTLMKYIYNDTRSSQILSQWSGSMPVLVATFFFGTVALGSKDRRLVYCAPCCFRFCITARHSYMCYSPRNMLCYATSR